jgi:hypothetical protein
MACRQKKQRRKWSLAAWAEISSSTVLLRSNREGILLYATCKKMSVCLRVCPSSQLVSPTEGRSSHFGEAEMQFRNTSCRTKFIFIRSYSL